MANNLVPRVELFPLGVVSRRKISGRFMKSVGLRTALEGGDVGVLRRWQEGNEVVSQTWGWRCDTVLHWRLEDVNWSPSGT